MQCHMTSYLNIAQLPLHCPSNYRGLYKRPLAQESQSVQCALRYGVLVHITLSVTADRQCSSSTQHALPIDYTAYNSHVHCYWRAVRVYPDYSHRRLNGGVTQSV